MEDFSKQRQQRILREQVDLNNKRQLMHSLLCLAEYVDKYNTSSSLDVQLKKVVVGRLSDDSEAMYKQISDQEQRIRTLQMHADIASAL